MSARPPATTLDAAAGSGLDTAGAEAYYSCVNDSELSDDPLPTAHLLLAAARALEVRLEQALAPLDLSLAKFGVLRHLAQAGEPLPLGALAQRSACVRSNMTQLADRLEADGLVRRADDPHDRRCVNAELTAKGLARYRQAATLLAQQERQLGQVLGARERATLGKLAQELIEP